MSDASIQAMTSWVAENLMNVAKVASSPLPFSFMVGQTPSSAFLPSCKLTCEAKPLDKVRAQHTLTWKDAATSLEICCVAVQYSDYPTVEWTLWFKNAGTQESPAISGIRALNVKFPRPQDKDLILHTIRGSLAQRDDFEPRTIELGPSSTTCFAPGGGRSTSGGWPYWNIEFGERGVIAVLGWPGQWDASFICDEATCLTVSGGLGQFNSVLRPGEEVRSPLALLQFRQGGQWLDAQNTWRHFYVDHVIPRVDGHVPKPFTATCVDDSFPNMLSTAAGTTAIMDAYAAQGHKFDYWWTDAGWYDVDTHWWDGVGSWTPHPKRWPNGLKEAADHAHSLGMKYIVWFEPERVAAGTWLDKNRPQWLLRKGDHDRLLDLGNDEARSWWTDFIDKFLTEQGIDVYRQDFNHGLAKDTASPLDLWQAADTPGRSGMTEMKYIMGYLNWHDELRRRKPGMLIDTCAGGGRRLDLETLRRAVPLLRTDYRVEANGCQQQTYGISQWVPYNGTGGPPTPPWMARTHMHACFAYGLDTAKADKAAWDLMKRMDAEWREIVDNFIYGDFFPLTDASLADDVWMAWQFHQGKRQVGVVQAFRHAGAPSTMTFRLKGLDFAATYELKDFDKGTSKAAGKKLMELGMVIELKGQPDSATIAYRKL